MIWLAVYGIGVCSGVLLGAFLVALYVRLGEPQPIPRPRRLSPHVRVIGCVKARPFDWQREAA